MYLRWLETHNYRSKLIEASPGEVAGIRSATVAIEGPYAYGYLKGEQGVHRLVRISPFDANHRRHTSFAAVTVTPQIEETGIEIRDEDLKIDTYRAGGAGGQHVNKTDSAVRITHLPTGLVVACQQERSQHQNKAIALQLLKARLYALQQQQKEKELSEVRGELRQIEWGSQIRSYVFQPYQLVKDHRTEVEVGNIESVMDGGLDPFIEGYLRRARK
jgi:peptide chain release factor 2